MKIVGFGDSFILGPPSPVTTITDSYQVLLGNKYNTYPEFRGKGGTGPWHAFFDFLEYFKKPKEKVNVVIMAWSEATRLYKPLLSQENAELAARASNNPNITYEDVFLAVQQYSQFIFDTDKQNYELRALMTMFDDMALEYPNIKFINLHSFSWLDKNFGWKSYDYASKLKYHYTFKNTMEIRPCLMHLSRKEGWPGDENMHLETRECHLSPTMHRLVADAIIEAIENYSPGKIVNIGNI